MKRILSFALTLVMLLSFAGSAMAAYDEHMTISWTSVMEGDEGNDYTQDAIYKTIAEKFNVDFDIRPLTWGNWTTNVNLYINGMNLPDATNWFFNYSDYKNYVEQDLLYRFPLDWEERWPGVAEVYAKTGLKGHIEDEDGYIYCLPVPTYFNNKPVDTLPSHLTIYARKDWIEQVTGEPVKPSYTFSEFTEICRKLKETNPAGVENFYPMVAATSMLMNVMVGSGYEHTLSGYDIYQGSDGQYHWGPGDEQTYNALKYVQDLWKAGYIAPEFDTLNQGEDEDMMSIAHSSAMCIAGGMASNYTTFYNEEISSGLDPAVNLCGIFLTDDEGVFHSTEATNYFGALIFNPDLDDEKFARIMDVIQFSLTKEGQDLIHLGIEGTDFTKNADGTYNMLHEYTTIDTYPSNRFFCTLASRRDDFNLVNPSYQPAARDFQRNQYINKYNLLKDSLGAIDFNYTFYTSDAKTRLGSIQSAYLDDYANLITKDGDLRANWEAWCADKMGMVQPVLDEMNALIGK